MNLIKRQERDRPACPVDHHRRLQISDQMRTDDRWIGTARWRFHAIAEGLAQMRHRRLIRVDRDAFALNHDETTDVIDPVNMIRMRMGVENRVEALDIVVDHLLAKIRAGIDHHNRFATVADPAHHESRTGTPIFRV